MDPVTALGAAGSVVGIAGFGLQLSEVLIKFISKVRSAQDHLDEVVTEIDATASALQELYSFLKQEVRNVESDKSLRLFSESSLVKVKRTADNCLVVFWRIETNIAGSEPDGFEEELAKRLTSFNRRLESYGLGHHVMVGSPITPDPLSFRRKVRWAFQASKLDKFCKDLQRYQGHLSLLLQIVLLGQQQMKQNPTTQDILLMRQTFAFITQIATPEELKLMAIEAQEDGERRRSRSKAPAGSRVPRPSVRPHTRSPGRPNSPKSSQPPGQTSQDQTRYQFSNSFVSWDTGTRHTRTTSPLGDRPTRFDYTPIPKSRRRPTTSLHGGETRADDRTFRSSAPAPPAKPPPMPNRSRPSEGGQYTGHVPPGETINSMGDAMTPPSVQQNVNPTSVNHKVSLPDVANDVNGTNSGRQPNGSLSQHDSDQINGSLDEQKQQMPNAGPRKHETTNPTQRQETAHDGASSADVSSTQARGPVSMAKGDTLASQPEVTSSVITSNGREPGEKAASNSSEAGSKLHQDHDPSAQNAASGPGTEILPYVIHEERAYQLPISLKLTSINTNSVPPEHDLAIELAFLNAGQLQTLQRLLQYRGETGARKLIRLEVAKKPARRFWQRPRRVTVAFVEGEASGMPVSVLPHGDASHRQLKDVDQLGQGSLPSRIGLPNFQDVTNDLINDIIPWNQTTDRERFTEYRVWHIEPFSASEAGGESTKDWARSLLREENLPRSEIKRRLRILDKDSSTVIAKSTLLTPAQQFQVWRSLEAAKLGEPDPGYQWTLRQLEVIWSRRFFIVKQAKAIIVYVTKAPEFPYNDTLDDATQNAPKINPHNDSHDVDASDGSLLERRRRAIDHANDLIASRPRPLSPPRQILTTVAGADLKTEDELAREREDELVREIQRLEHQIKQSREFEEESERRSQITPEMQRRARSERHNKPDWVEQKPLPIGASANLVRERRELDVEEPHISTRAAETPPRYRDTSRDGSPRNRASVRFLERSRSNTSRQQDTQTRYPSQFDRSRFDPRPPERSDAETSEDETIASHIERVREDASRRGRVAERFDARLAEELQFQKRHNRLSAPSRSVARSVARSGAESQYAVEQLLLEWTPAQIRDSDDEDNAGSEVNSENGDAGDIILQSVREETDQRGRLPVGSDARLDWGEYESDAGSEEFVMAKESPTQESSLVSQREQAEGDQIGTKVDDDQQDPEDGEKALHDVPPPTVDDAGDRQNSLEHDEQATHDGAMPRSRGAPWIPIPGPISNSPQQLSRPSSKNTNADRAGEEIPKGAPQTQGRQKATAQKPDGTARLFQRGKKLARASTLPQASRQPWSDEDWARQIVEETAETARTSDYEAQPDRLKARRASFHFTAPRPRGQESKSKSHDDFWDMPAPSRKRP